jgi:hypothetical protein
MLLQYHGRNSTLPVDSNSCRMRARISKVSFVRVNLCPTILSDASVPRMTLLTTFVSFKLRFRYLCDTLAQKGLYSSALRAGLRVAMKEPGIRSPVRPSS